MEEEELKRRVNQLREQAKTDGRDLAMVHDRAVLIFEYLYDFSLEHGYSPTYRQIGEACGITSTSLISLYLGQLQRAGVITRDSGVSRSILIIPSKEVESGLSNTRV